MERLHPRAKNVNFPWLVDLIQILLSPPVTLLALTETLTSLSLNFSYS